MDMNGYKGKIAVINLTSNEITEKEISEQVARKYIGGSGFGAMYLFQLTDGATDPLGPDNALIFMTGPLTGSKAFSTDRWQVVTKSPLTGCFGEANCGGTWGSTLRRSGFDGVIIVGKSAKPVFIDIDAGKISIETAETLWGLDNFETHEKMDTIIPGSFQALTIGQAGENQVLYASISSNGRDARVAGRSGCGAVMGAKNLKAVAVRGNEKFDLYDAEGLRTYIKEHAKEVANHPVSVLLRDAGTSCGMLGGMEIGNTPIKNWSAIDFPDMGKIDGNTMRDTILTKRYYCGSCVVGCGRTIEVNDGKYRTDGQVAGPEYESSGLLGSNLMINNIEAVCKLNDLCNRYGMDTISTGSVIGMVMECVEKGIISETDLDGIKPVWGDADSAIELIHKIANLDGVGILLGKGTKRIGDHFGPDALKLAPHVKGLEFAAHDPRAKVGTALSYVTSNRGACHMAGATSNYESCFPLPDLGYEESPDRFEIEGKAQFVIDFQNFHGMFDSLSCCKFMAHQSITLDPILDILNLVTGFDFDRKEFLQCGERIFTLKRLYNTKCGITSKDDTLPERFLNFTIPGEERVHMIAPIESLLAEYYSLRGWDSDGIPTNETLARLGLSSVNNES